MNDMNQISQALAHLIIQSRNEKAKVSLTDLLKAENFDLCVKSS